MKISWNSFSDRGAHSNIVDKYGNPVALQYSLSMPSKKKQKLYNLITKARLSLTHSLIVLSHVPKSKHIHSAKIKGLVCISLQSFPGGRVVKALDCRSDEDVRAGLIPVTGSFFFNDDRGASCSGASERKV